MPVSAMMPSEFRISCVQLSRPCARKYIMSSGQRKIRRIHFLPPSSSRTPQSPHNTPRADTLNTTFQQAYECVPSLHDECWDRAGRLEQSGVSRVLERCAEGLRNDCEVVSYPDVLLSLGTARILRDGIRPADRTSGDVRIDDPPSCHVVPRNN